MLRRIISKYEEYRRIKSGDTWQKGQDSAKKTMDNVINTNGSINESIRMLCYQYNNSFTDKKQFAKGFIDYLESNFPKEFNQSGHFYDPRESPSYF